MLSGPQKATYLYTLMFYQVVSYCSSYIKEVYERRNWSPYVTITEASQVKHLGMSATKLTLEWTKELLFHSLFPTKTKTFFSHIDFDLFADRCFYRLDDCFRPRSRGRKNYVGFLGFDGRFLSYH